MNKQFIFTKRNFLTLYIIPDYIYNIYNKCDILIRKILLNYYFTLSYYCNNKTYNMQYIEINHSIKNVI